MSVCFAFSTLWITVPVSLIYSAFDLQKSSSYKTNASTRFPSTPSEIFKIFSYPSVSSS